MNKILITGGAGFIGQKLVKALLNSDANCSICVFDNLHPQVHGENASPPEFSKSVEFVYGDVSDQASLEGIVKAFQPTIIYHLAAETGTGQSYDEPTRYCNVNVIGTTNLVESIRKVNSVKKVILSASRAVYGEGAYVDGEGKRFVGLPRNADTMSLGHFEVPLPADATPPFLAAKSSGNLPVAPASIYASTKLMQEYILTQAGEGSSWKTVILRFQNVYGPGQSLNNPYTGVLSIFSKLLLSGQSLSIYEDGKIARDFVFVDDVVNALVLGASVEVPHATILDIGSGQAATILDVAKILMKALINKEDAFKITGQFRVGDIRHACADISQAKKILGWEPKVTLVSGLTQLAEWAKAN